MLFRKEKATAVYCIKKGEKIHRYNTKRKFLATLAWMVGGRDVLLNKVSLSVWVEQPK